MTEKCGASQELQAWRAFRRAAELASGRIVQSVTRATGLSAADFSVLMQLDDLGKGRRRQRDLQEFLEWDKTRLSHQLTRMTARGLILRENYDRGVIIAITDQGRQQLIAARSVHAEGVREYFSDRLSPEDLEQIHKIASKLRDGLLGLDRVDSAAFLDVEAKKKPA